MKSGRSLINSFEFSLKFATESTRAICELRRVLNQAPLESKESVEKLNGLLPTLEVLAGGSPPNRGSDCWEIAVEGVRVVTSTIECGLVARGAEGNLVSAKSKRDFLWSDFRKLLTKKQLPKIETVISEAVALSKLDEVDLTSVVKFLLSLPLPTIYFAKVEAQSRSPYREPSGKAEITHPLLRIIVFLDHAPVASPQLVKSQTLYPVTFKVRGLAWPKDANKLRLDFLTTVPKSEFVTSNFIIERPPQSEGEFNAELSGQIKFESGQSSLLDDLVFQVRAAFELENGEFRESPVVGHDELRLRVVSENHHPLMSGNRSLDRHIEELATGLIERLPRVKAELPNLLPILQGLTRLLAAYAQEAIYKGRNDVSEAEFQKQVLRDLRLQQGLGQEVIEAPKQAGGITDVKFRDVTVELKVEKIKGDREYISKKYSKQPVQYSGVDAKQVSVLLVLDLTPKTHPPGDIRNDIMLQPVNSHGGGSKEFESEVFVFVINGNMNNPSDYSK